MSTTQSERIKQRRRLLKSAAAAPAIFVLPTGAAIANSSLSGCVTKGINNNPAPAQTTNAPDGWVRVRNTVTPPNPQTYDLVPNNVDGRFVYGASCWNSVHPGGPMADQNNLIP